MEGKSESGRSSSRFNQGTQPLKSTTQGIENTHSKENIQTQQSTQNDLDIESKQEIQSTQNAFSTQNIQGIPSTQNDNSTQDTKLAPTHTEIRPCFNVINPSTFVDTQVNRSINIQSSSINNIV